MYQLLLAILYFAFLSTGLPDALLGSAWPAMRSEFNVTLSYAGIISLIVTVCIVISSLSARWVTQKLGAARIVALSAFLSAGSMIAYANADSLLWLCLFAIPYGLAAGCIDTVLNNYVSLHYSARHMSWLHAVWGVGASASPLIMGLSLTYSNQWQTGYWVVGILQIFIAIILCLSIPIWKKKSERIIASSDERLQETDKVSNIVALRTPGVIFVLMCFFAYGAIEVAASLWAASFLVEMKGLSFAYSSFYASLFFVGVILGRFLNGVIAPYCPAKKQITGGAFLILLGVLLLYAPALSAVWSVVGLLLIGIGGAPICPALFYVIPHHFGEAKSMTIAGLQMAFSYIGASLMPPVLGLLAEYTGLMIYPAYLAFWACFVLLMQWGLARTVKEDS